MIKWYCNNHVTNKQIWTYETLAHDAGTIEDMLYAIALRQKESNKSTYISICGFNERAVASVKVEYNDLYAFNGKGHVACLVLYKPFYKIRFSSFGAISIIPVQL